MKLVKYTLIFLLFFIFSCVVEDAVVDPDPVNISIMDITVDEGSKYSVVSVELSLDTVAASQITLNVSTSDDSATSGEDFVGLVDEMVVFAVGETTKTVKVDIIGDLLDEEDESFDVLISNVSGPAVIADGTAVVNILNDDVPGEKMIEVEAEIEWDQLMNLTPGDEVPYEIMNFGQPSNIPNAEFTSVGTTGDTILIAPKMSPEGDTILYHNVPFVSPGESFITAFAKDFFNTDLPNGFAALAWEIFIVGQDTEDFEFKYGIEFYVGTVDQGRLGPFFIDPKIRVPK